MGRKQTTHDALSTYPCSGAIATDISATQWATCSLGGGEITFTLRVARRPGMEFPIQRQLGRSPVGIWDKDPRSLRQMCMWTAHIYVYTSMKETNAGVFLRDLSLLLPVCWSIDRMDVSQRPQNVTFVRLLCYFFLSCFVHLSIGLDNKAQIIFFCMFGGL